MKKSIRKILILTLTFIMAICGTSVLTACLNGNSTPTEVNIRETSKRIELGTEGAKINVSVRGADEADLIVESVDEDIAYVEEVDGRYWVRPVSVGETTIEAYLENNPEIFDECTIEVTSTPSVTLDRTTLDLGAGESQQLTATIGGVSGSAVWQSSNTAIATVSTTGLVTAVSRGTATIRVSIQGQTQTYAECEVTVTDDRPLIIVETTSLDVVLGATAQIIATKENSTADLTYSSNNTEIATVDANGVVSGLKIGSTTVTVAMEGANSMAVDINVVESNCEGNHIFGEWQTNDGYHWKQCQNCSVRISYGQHKGESASCTEQSRCEVCDKVISDALGHNFDGGVYASDGTQHWKECSRCGVEDVEHKENHTGGTATCDKGEQCTVCNREYGTALGHDYEKGQYLTNGEYHWKQCSRCTSQDLAHREAHVWNGENSCEIARECSVCRKAEDVKTHDFEHGEYKADETHHWKKCADCTVEDTAHKVAHSGGNPTCASKAICEACQKEYGEGGTHDFDNGTYLSDETHHWKKCANCTVEDTAHKVAHFGGTASCSQLAQCTDCKSRYGELLAHDYVNGSWVENGTGHAKQCAKCSSKTQPVNVYGRTLYENKNGKNAIVLMNTAGAVEIKFVGTELKASILQECNLNNNNGTTGYQSLRIFVDDKVDSTKLVLNKGAGYQDYTLVSGLENTTHTVTIYKVLESRAGFIYISNFSGSNIEYQTPALKPTVKMEVYGDSITCGYGILGLSDSADHSDGTLTYHFLAAQKLGYQLEVVSMSGIALELDVWEKGITLDQAYNKYSVHNSTQWSFDDPAEVVVINVGTNDWTGINDYSMGTVSQFTTAYKNFLQEMRRTHPSSHIFCVYGMMTNSLNTDIQKVIDGLGDSKIYGVGLLTDTSGGNGHPAVTTSADNAEVLADFIYSKMNTKNSSNSYSYVPNGVSYNANLSNGKPSDWTLFNKCDTANSSITKSSNGVVVTNSSTSGAPAYYGTVYEIGNISNVRNFVLDMEFKVNSYVDEARWFGLMYHTKKTSDGNIQAFMMNYRVQGKSAQSTINYKDGSTAFNDDFIVDSGLPKLNDGGYHTLRIVHDGGSASHYMDGILIMSYITRIESDDHFAGRASMTSGGFALVVNKMALEISSLKIVGTESQEVQGESWLSPTLYNPTTNLASAPTVVQKVETATDISAIKNNTTIAQNAILYIDANMRVVDQLGNRIGSYELKDLISGSNVAANFPRTLPIVYIKDYATALNFVNYYKQNNLPVDMSVMSNDLRSMKYVKDGISDIRGIMDFTEYDITAKEDFDYVIQNSNVSMAGIVMLSFENATADTIRYIQARNKTVWVDVKDYGKLASDVAIANGTYGLVTGDYTVAFNSITNFKGSGTLINRQGFNIAHRGAVHVYPELSFEGYKNSYEQYGANHFEIDVWLTKDKQFVLCHDSTIDSITNQTGAVNAYTLSELQDTRYTWLDVVGIPYQTWTGARTAMCSLAQIFDYVHDKDDVVVVFEMKDNTYEAYKLLRELMDRYENEGKDVYDQTFLITQKGDLFLGASKGLIPRMPTSSLVYNSGGSGILANVGWYTRLNAGLDFSYGHYASNVNYPANIRELVHRGMATWNWTYENIEDYIYGLKIGVLGPTTNVPHKVNSLVESLEHVSGNTFKTVTYTQRVKGGGTNVTATLMNSGVINGKTYSVYYHTINNSEYMFNYTLYGTTVA